MSNNSENKEKTFYILLLMNTIFFIISITFAFMYMESSTDIPRGSRTIMYIIVGAHALYLILAGLKIKFAYHICALFSYAFLSANLLMIKGGSQAERIVASVFGGLGLATSITMEFF
jgi:hypothetical protein